jgi:hypothetical protein
MTLPDYDERLERVLRKAKWAHEQCRRLREAIWEYKKTHPYTLVPHQEFDGQQHVFVTADVKPPPDHIGMLVGDTAHAARTCLDHLAYALAPTPNIDTMFPIWDKPRHDRNGDKLPLTIAGGISAKCRKLVYQVQPYFGGENPNLSPLIWLRELDNIDKHRIVLTAAASHSAANHGFRPAVEPAEVDMIPTWGLLIDGEEICRFIFGRPMPEQYIEFDIVPEVCVKDVHPIVDQNNIVKVLIKSIREVESVAEQFKTFLKR